MDQTDGKAISASESMTYLGSLLHSDGGIKRDLSRKLGQAWSDFINLSRLWNHSSISVARKCELLQSIVTSKLFFGLPTSRPAQAEWFSNQVPEKNRPCPAILQVASLEQRSTSEGTPAAL